MSVRFSVTFARPKTQSVLAWFRAKVPAPHISGITSDAKHPGICYCSTLLNDGVWNPNAIIGYMTTTNGQPDSIEKLASDYLEQNQELRSALGIHEDEILIPHHLGMGEHNLNYWFQDSVSREKYVLRINVTRQPFHKNQVLYEYDALTALESSGCTPQPLYLDDSANAPCEGAMIISFCEGSQLDFDHLKPCDLQRAACLMANIHAVLVPDGCKLYRPANPIRKLFDECLGRYEMYKSSGFADPEVEQRMERFIRITEQAVDQVGFDPANAQIVNTETLASHFLLPEKLPEKPAGDCDVSSDTIHGEIRNHPGYFVDWERPILGDIAEDVAFFVAPTTTFWDSDLLFPTDRIQSFVEMYWDAVDDRFARNDFDNRFQAFLKVAVFRALTWCCRAVVQQHEKPEIHITNKALAKVPIYLSNDFMDYLEEECFSRLNSVKRP